MASRALQVDDLRRRADVRLDLRRRADRDDASPRTASACTSGCASSTVTIVPLWSTSVAGFDRRTGGRGRRRLGTRQRGRDQDSGHDREHEQAEGGANRERHGMPP